MWRRTWIVLSAAWLIGVPMPSTRAEPPSFEQHDVFVSGEGGYHTYRIPAVVVSKKGTVLAFCEGRKNSSADAGDIDLLLRRSFDNGRSWQATQLVHEDGGAAEITIGNPAPMVDADGTIHLFFCRNNAKVFYMKSTDDGRTFSAPLEISHVLRGVGFPWKRVGTGPGHGIQTRSGRIIVTVWLNDRIGGTYRSGSVRSDDSGKTWNAGSLVSPTIKDCSEATAVETADGSILLNMRNQSGKCRAVAFSRDGAETWSTPKAAQELIDPVCQAAVLRFSFGNGSQKSRILFSNAASPRRDSLTVKLSYDEGRSWPVARLVHPGPSAYSDLAVSKDLTILCLYERGEKGPYEKLTLARFNLQWLSSEKDHAATAN